MVSGQRMAVDAGLIEADANKQNASPKLDRGARLIDPSDALRADREYLDAPDNAAFGEAAEVQPEVHLAFRPCKPTDCGPETPGILQLFR